ncbi:hypothetical protein AYI68_g5593 [Smittium mucronatum]|nr:hypothetical protein AYI68_g5593 [Smittium mucronatum]
MSEDTNAKLNEFTALLHQPMRKRKSELDDEGPFITPRIPVTKITFDGLHYSAAERFSIECGEDVRYHAATDSDGTFPSHTTDRLLRTQKDSRKYWDHNHRRL